MEGRAVNAGGIFRAGMRAYFIPLGAGVALAASAFLPWVVVGGVSMQGVPDVAALWIAGLGALAAILAMLSLVTRKNSRHPLLIIGLFALGIMFLSWRIMPQTAGERALTIAQAFAIVENTTVTSTPVADVGTGIYLGFAASCVLVAFGLTIIVKRVAQPYVATSPDDDVE
jgi:FtsH-binding integral membrane protein